LFSVFLGITTLAEIIANFFISVFHLKFNFPVYNIFMLIEYPLLAFYFSQIISSDTFKKIIISFIFFYPVLWCITFFSILKKHEFNSYGVMGGDLFIVIICARYLYELFTSTKLILFKKHAEFWIAIGLMFYSCCELPITGILNFLEQDWQMVRQLSIVLQILNIIMYSIFIYAFLCPIKTIPKS